MEHGNTAKPHKEAVGASHTEGKGVGTAGCGQQGEKNTNTHSSIGLHVRPGQIMMIRRAEAQRQRATMNVALTGILNCVEPGAGQGMES